MTFPDVIGLYQHRGVRLRPPPTSLQQWTTVRCFTGAHNDRHPSARVNLRSGGFRCFACGAAGGALAALEILGVYDPDERVRLAVEYGILDEPVKPRPKPPIPPPTPPPPVAPQPIDYNRLDAVPAGGRERCWTYTDAAGTPVGRVKRLDMPAGKRVWQERPEGDQWLPGLEGRLLPLFRLPEVLEHARDGDQVLIVEGEKACDALDRIGMFATTNAGGAGKWRDDHTMALTGATVTAIVDSDLAGRLHGADVTERLDLANINARMPLDLGELRNDGYDVVDYLTGLAETLRAIQPEIDPDNLRLVLQRSLQRELGRQLPADHDALRRFVERARYIADPDGRELLECDQCRQERPHRVSHGIAFCPCGHHRPVAA